MKKIISIILTLVMLLFLVACGSSKLTSGDLIGTWSGSWEYNDSNINSSIEFKRDGTFEMESYINNKPSKSETGTYTINGGKVEICYDKDKSTASYKYSDGKLSPTSSGSPANYSKESK